MTFDTIKLDKGLYTSDKGFTSSLEAIDPSENYKGTELEGLDAYERQLKRFDIKVKGPKSDPISKFFQTSDSAVLFPEFITRSVATVVTSKNVVDELIATTTNIDSMDYRSVQCEAIEPDNAKQSFINEGAFIPETSITLRDKLTTLKKSGRTFVASYEAIKSQRLDLFSVTLKQIGNYINTCQLSQAVEVLAELGTVDINTIESNSISYKDFIDIYTALAPYEFNTVIAETAKFNSILSLDEFRDGAAGLNMHATGNMITPYGAKLIHCQTNILHNDIVAFDKNYALEKVQLGNPVDVDYDKIIDRQLERATVTSIVGFNRIVDKAVLYLAETV